MVESPQVVAHRGLASTCPENTLESIAAAITAGIRFVEFDIQLSADEVPVLIHDDQLTRTAARPGCVMDMSWTDLSSVTVGETERLGQQYAGTLLPSLEQARLLIADHPGVTAFVEIKTESLSRFGTDRVLDRCMEALDTLLPHCVITSFDAAVLEIAREKYDAAIAWVLTTWDDDSLAAGAALQPEFLFCNYKKLPPAPLMLPQGEWEWVLYEVIDAALALELHARGAGFIESMDAGDLVKSLVAARDNDHGS
ncbi:MAG: glycerophosphodiester phosphodiesterase family protein [Gammaproteobacteria bacterium]